MPLTQASKKYWYPVQQVIDYLSDVVIKPGEHVLEIGPADNPFKRANVFVDFSDVKGAIKCDVACEQLPFKDKEFDFVYARHLLEDSWNPFHICKEMSRVAKRGYIETPSPIAEIAKGVDGGSPPFRGFHHHRYVVWMSGKQLKLISKYPFIEFCRFNEGEIEQLLTVEKYWNTYMIWQDTIDFHHIQSPLDYNIPTEYAKILSEAVDQSKKATDAFFAGITK